MTGRSRNGRKLIAMALVWVGVAAFAWLAGGAPEPTDGWVVERGDLAVTVPVSGTLETESAARLGPPMIPGLWQYKIARLIPEGTEVEPGDPVMAFDTSDLVRQRLTKAAERDSAAGELTERRTELDREIGDAELELAKSEAERVRAELKIDVPADLVGRNELARARLDLDLAQREEDHQRSRIDLLRRKARAEIAALVEKRDRAAERVREIDEYLERMVVTAPEAGTVIYVTDWQGEKHKVGDQVWQLRKVLEIPDLTRLRGRAEVAEADAGKVAVGRPVTLRFDAQPDTEIRGRVARVHRTVQPATPGNPRKVVRLDLTLETPGDDARLRPGMRFRGELSVQRREGVLWVPPDALADSADGPVAYRRTWHGAEAVPVTLGLVARDRVEIVTGLAEGDRLAPPAASSGEG